MSLIGKIGLHVPIFPICIITVQWRWNMLEFKKKLDKPIWMMKDGVKCAVDYEYGCRVTHTSNTPEMCLFGDEVGGNICMAGDGHIGGELFLAEKGTNPENKTSKTNQTFIVDRFHCFHRRA